MDERPECLKVHGYHALTNSYLTDYGVLTMEDVDQSVRDGEFVVGVGSVDENLRWPE
jgi:hypothetical protein